MANFSNDKEAADGNNQHLWAELQANNKGEAKDFVKNMYQIHTSLI